MKFASLIEMDRHDDHWAVRWRFVDEAIGEVTVVTDIPPSEKEPTLQEIERHCVQAGYKMLADLNRRHGLQAVADGDLPA